MKKITLVFFMSLLSFLGFAQFHESFDSGIPGTWSVMDNGVGIAQSWTTTTTSFLPTHGGAQHALIDRGNIGAGNTSEDWLVTPQLTIPTNGQLRFWTKMTLSGDNGTLYQLRVSTTSQTNQASFTQIQQWTESELEADMTAGGSIAYNVYGEIIKSLGAYAGQNVYLAFVRAHQQTGATTTGDRWLIDDVNVAQQCTTVSGLTASSVTATSALLGWTSTGPATSWDIEMMLSSATSTGVPTHTSVSSPYTYTGLTPCTAYKFYVRSLCSPTVSSVWSGPFHFTTLPPTGSDPCPFSAIISATQDIPTSGLFAQVIGGTPPFTYQWSLNGTPIQGATSQNLAVNGQGGTYQVIVTDSNNVTTTATITIQGITIAAYNDAMTVYPTSNTTVTTSTSVLANDGINSHSIYNLSDVILTPLTVPSGFTINPNGTISVLPGTAAGIYTLTYQICATQSPTICSTAAATVTVANAGFLLNAFLDSNNNGVKDAGELPFNYGQFHYQVNNAGNTTTVYPSNGIYYIQESNVANTYDFNFVIDPQYSTYYSLTASYNDVSYVAGSAVIVYNFPVTELPYTDASVILFPNGAPPRPGFNYSNRIVIRNVGNQPIPSGTITFTKDSRVGLVSVTGATTVINANGFTHTFTNLLPNEIRYITVVMSVPTIPTINLNDILTNTVALTGVAGDAVASNNNVSLSQTVVGSYDPNDKTESHGGKIVHSSFTSNDYLTYTIQFENTGTYQAENVRINDILDVKLDETSIKMVNASHSYNLTRVNNTLNWNFNGIDLAPSGKGAVTFQIKPKPGYALGDIIPNTASIYFDFNPAIVTNTYNTEFVTAMSVSEFGSSAFLVYPNPTKGFVNISSKDNSYLIDSVIVNDILGKTIQTKTINSASTTIDLSDLSSGIYFAKVKSANSESILKIVKQ